MFFPNVVLMLGPPPHHPQLRLVFVEAQTQHPQDGGQELDPQTHLEVIKEAQGGGRGRERRGKKGREIRRKTPFLSQHTDAFFPPFWPTANRQINALKVLQCCRGVKPGVTHVLLSERKETP